MAKLACPCGNTLSNSRGGDETLCYFVANSVLEAHIDDFAFFEVKFNDLATEIWKCDVCDRMMVFDNPYGPVSRYMRRIDAESLSEDDLAREHRSGILFSDLLFNDVGSFLSRWRETDGVPDYEMCGNPGEPNRGPLFTYRLMKEKVFSHANGRFRSWWYADMYEDLLVCYPPFKDEKTSRPVKAWRRYNQVWPYRD